MLRSLVEAFAAGHEPRRPVPDAFDCITDADEIQPYLASRESDTSFGSRDARTSLRTSQEPARQGAMQLLHMG